MLRPYLIFGSGGTAAIVGIGVYDADNAYGAAAPKIKKVNTELIIMHERNSNEKNWLFQTILEGVGGMKRTGM